MVNPPLALGLFLSILTTVSFATTNDCLEKSHDRFYSIGNHDFKIISEGSYTYYIPERLQKNCKAPVVAFAVGTLMPSSLYRHWHKHFASHGFAVVADHNTMAITGRSLKRGIDRIYRMHPDKLAPVAATIGHSQGGAGALYARTHEKVTTVIGIQPGQFPIASRAKINFLGLAGSTDVFGVLTDPSLFHYRQVKGPKFYGNLAGAGHITDTIRDGEKARSYRAMATAWLRCFLSKERESCSLFTGPEKCSAFKGNWRHCKHANLGGLQ